MKRIGIIGTGRLGLAFGLLCEQNGYHVMGMDNRPDYVKSLNDKTFKSSEPYVEEYLQQSKNFHATTDLKKTVEFSDLLFCFVVTPSMSNGKYSHTAIDEVVEGLERLHSRGVSLFNKTLVIGCTVMPGYTKTVQDKLDALGVKVIYNPEFIAQGSIIDNLKTADMILIGTMVTQMDDFAEVYYSIMTRSTKFNFMSPTAAEICKIGLNCFLATKIAFTNMIGEIAINSEVGDEVQTILDAIGDDRRVGKPLTKYGFGYGGPCIPRDGKALGVHAGEVGVEARLCQTTDSMNNLHSKFLKNYFIEKNPDKSIPFLFTQLAYKKGTDILTESQQYKLCKDLLETGYSVCIDDSQSIINQVKLELQYYGNKVSYTRPENFYEITL